MIVPIKRVQKPSVLVLVYCLRHFLSCAKRQNMPATRDCQRSGLTAVVLTGTLVSFRQKTLLALLGLRQQWCVFLSLAESRQERVES